MLQFEIASNDRQIAMFGERDDEKWLIKNRGNDHTNRDADDEEAANLFLDFLEAGYDRFVLYLEDTVLVSPSPGKVVCLDVITGTTAQAEWTAVQVEAVCALAIGGDEINDALDYYEIAEDAIAAWPAECRPIP